MAGVLAKARVAKQDSIIPSGEESLCHTSDAEAWAWDVMNDLLRLAGGAQ